MGLHADLSQEVAAWKKQVDGEKDKTRGQVEEQNKTREEVEGVKIKTREQVERVKSKTIEQVIGVKDKTWKQVEGMNDLNREQKS